MKRHQCSLDARSTGGYDCISETRNKIREHLDVQVVVHHFALQGLRQMQGHPETQMIVSLSAFEVLWGRWVHLEIRVLLPPLALEARTTQSAALTHIQWRPLR